MSAIAAEVARLKEQPRWGHFEPLPHGIAALDGLEFRKLDFGLPKMRGAAAQWRLMYFLSLEDNGLFLFWVYSHAQFSKRPEPRELAAEINASLEEIGKQ